MPTPLKQFKNHQNWCMFTQMFAPRKVLTFKSHPKRSLAYLIKWTTSGEPPVGLKTHQGSKLGHSAVILYIVL